MHTHTQIYIYLYVYLYVCVCIPFLFFLKTRVELTSSQTGHINAVLPTSANSHLLRLKRPSEQQHRMAAAVGTDKELSDLLDFSAVRCL